MRRLCQLCARFMGFVEPIKDQQVTLGICGGCEDEWLRQIQLSQFTRQQQGVSHAR